MAELYAGKKFDDPTKTVSQAVKKGYESFWGEAQRRALMGVLNHILFSANGTSSTGVWPATDNIGTGATGGVRIGNPQAAIINGRYGTIAVAADLELPAGTQSKNTTVKYLVSSGFGSSGTVTAGNEAAGTNATAAYLPDCPNGHCAIGYVQYTAHASYDYVRTNAVLTGMAEGTSGTAAFVSLCSMPLHED
jgi:hypothetical protein